MNVAVQAPAVEVNYVVRFRMVGETTNWFAPLTMRAIQVKNLTAAIAIINAGSETWRASETRTVVVQVTNRGTSTWPNTGAQRVQLAWFFDNGTPVKLNLPKAVAPSETVTISVTVRAPQALGRHILKFQLERLQFGATVVLTQRAITVQ